MVKTYADLYLDARKAMLPTDGMYAANMARELVCAASGKTPEQFIADRNLYASEEICAKTESFVRRHLAGEPVAYILGEWDFYDMTLTVTPAVLIPRDDTMAVTDLAIKKVLFLLVTTCSVHQYYVVFVPAFFQSFLCKVYRILVFRISKYRRVQWLI